MEIGKKINGNVSVGDIELSFLRSFPNASVLVHKVSITDTMFSQHHHTFLRADEIYALLSIRKIIQKKPAVNGIKIKNAAFYLFTDTSGYSNTYLLKPKKDSSFHETKTSAKNGLNSIVFKNVKVTVDDRKKLKLYNALINDLNIRLDDEDIQTNFSAKVDILVYNLAFNLPSGSFVKGKKIEGDFNFSLNKKLNQLQFDSIDIKISGHPFNLSGAFDLGNLNPLFKLRVHTKQIQYSFAKSLLTDKIAKALSIADVDRKFDADANLSGPLTGGDPLLNVNWSVKKSHLITPFLDFEDASFNGFYTNEVVAGEPRRDPNSKIVIKNFTASWFDLPVSSSNIEILNLYQPILTCDLTSSFPLSALNEVTGGNLLQLQSGEGALNLTYKGPVVNNNDSNSFINGIVSFKNGTALYEPRDVELKDMNGRLEITNSDVSVKNLQCVVLNNKILMNGRAKNLITLVNTGPAKMSVEWNIFSPTLNLSSFIYLMKSPKKVSLKKSRRGKLVKLAKAVDQLLEQGDIDVNLKTSKLLYKKFEATNAIANLSLLQDRYLIKKLSMDHAGGHIDLSGSLVHIKDNYHEAKADVSINNADINKVFIAFNNFGQDGIKAQNLEGKLTAKINASLALNDDGKAYPKSIKSTIDFSLKKGALNNFEPLKRIQSFIFKKRNFDNIRFAEIKNRIDISNQDIRINRMEVASTVITMYIEGIYSLKGNTDITIQVPLKSLKKHDENYIPENIGTDKKVGRSIFMRGTPGPDGNIQFAPDLFHSKKK